MKKINKLSDTEFEVMKIAWEYDPPITTTLVMERLGRHKNWKSPTVLSLMQRLVDKGFLRTEKNSKERRYYPIVDRDSYLAKETQTFMKNYHNNSLRSFVEMLFQDEEIKQSDADELLAALEKGKEKSN